MLACAEGASNTSVAEQLRCSRMSVGKWRSRFVESRLDGLLDESARGPTTHDQRGPGRGRDRGDLGIHARERDP